MNENWKDLSGFDGIYQISSLGRLRRVKIGKNGRGIGIIKSHPKIKGNNVYRMVKLYKNSAHKTFLVHRLVAETFLELPACCPTCNTKYEVNHKDGNGENNFVDNLEYCTPQQNIEHSRKKQQRNCSIKLTEEMVKNIKKERNAGEKGVIVAKKYNVTPSTVCDIMKGRLWKTVTI